MVVHGSPATHVIQAQTSFFFFEMSDKNKNEQQNLDNYTFLKLTLSLVKTSHVTYNSQS